MPTTSPAKLLTTGQIAQKLGEPLHRVDYVIKSRGIEPTTRIGLYRVFDAAAVIVIREAMKAMPTSVAGSAA